MSAQRSFHIVMLGLALCSLSSVFSKVMHKSDNEVGLKSDASLTSVRFWKEAIKELRQGSGLDDASQEQDQ